MKLLTTFWLSILLAVSAIPAAAQVPIANLPAATAPLSGSEVLPIVQSGRTVKASTNQVSNVITTTANTWTGLQTFAGGVAGAGPGSGDVSGTGASLAGDLACYTSTSGKILTDCQNYSHSSASALSGSETILGVQSGTTVKITPAQISTYSGSAITTTGPYIGQVAQALPAALQPTCLSIFSYLTAPQQAAVQAGTSTVDFAPILTAAISAISVNPLVGTQNGTNVVCFPPGKFPFLSAVDIKHTVVIRGAGGNGAGGGGFGTWLQFPASNTGLIVDRHNTLGSATVASTTGGDGTVIEDLAIVGSGSTADTYGVWMRARATLRNVTVSSFGNDVQIAATAGGGGASEGNANGWLLDQVTVNNAITGVFLEGGDVNAGSSLNLNCANIRGWCLRDNSFLGNSHIQPESATTGTLSRVTRSAVNYVANPTTTSALLGSTTPGTDANVWVSLGAGSSYATWVNGGTYYPGGHFYIGGNNSRTTVIGAYGESDSPPSYAGPKAIIIGGLNAAGWSASGTNGFLILDRIIRNFDGIDGSSASFGTAIGGTFDALLLYNGNPAQYARQLFSSGYRANGVTRFNVGAVRARAVTGNDSDNGLLSLQYWNAGAVALADILTVGGATPAVTPASDNVFPLGLSSARWSDVRTVLLNGVAPVVAGAYTSAPLTMATSRILGRTTASTGAVEEITVGGGVTLSGGAISLTTPPLAGTTPSIGGGALLAGACASDVATVTGATTSMAASASPVTYPGDGNYWLAYVSSSNTVTVKVCAAVAGTPSASAYNVRVLQ